METELLSDEQIRESSPEQRLRLIGQLWDSLADVDVPVSAHQRAELDRRLATFDSDRRDAISWDTVNDTLTRQCP